MHQKRAPKNSLTTILLVGLLAACQSNTVYHSFHTLPHDGWNKSDTLTFIVPTDRLENGEYTLQVEIRHTQSYEYQTLWMTLYQNEKDSLNFSADTIQCTLTDEKSKFKGNVLSSYYQLSIPVKKVTLNQPYSPVFKLAHYMKKGRLEGIHDVGIRITR